MSLTVKEQAEVDAANASGRQPVVFVHGLWLLPSSWHLWRELFEARGYATVAPGWPDDPETVAEARANPDRFAMKTVAMVHDHMAEAIRGLKKTPFLIGHSFGGLFVQQLAGMGLSAGTVAIDPAPHRGILPLPASALKAALPAVGNPFNVGKAKALTAEQYRYAFGNALPQAECTQLHETYHVPGPCKPLFQVAFANLNPWSETKVNVKHPQRGPLMVFSGDKDHTVPHSIAHATYKRQCKNAAVTEFHEFTDRGHSLIIDHGWKEVAEVAATFLEKHATGAAVTPAAKVA